MHDYTKLTREEKLQLVKTRLETKRFETKSLMSSHQRRLWFASQFEEANVAYNLCLEFMVSGRFNVDTFKQAVNFIHNRHDAFRTYFVCKNDEYIQVVDKRIRPIIVEGSLDEGANSSDSSVDIAKEPFDLNRGPLARFQILVTKDGDHEIKLVMHHIISDSVSMELIRKELFLAYSSLDSNLPVMLDSISYQYSNFATYENKYVNSPEYLVQLDYWKNQLRELPSQLDIPTDKARPFKKAYRGQKQYFSLDKHCAAEIHRVCSESGCTPFMFILACFKLLLSVLCRSDDIVIGATYALRNDPRWTNVVGMLTNNLALRSKIDWNISFDDFLRRVKETSLDGYRNGDIPFSDVVEKVAQQTLKNLTPLFQVMFTYHGNKKARDFTNDNFNIVSRRSYRDRSIFDLSLDAVEIRDGFYCYFEYDSEIFFSKTIEAFSQLLVYFVDQALKFPSSKLANFSVVGPKDIKLMASKSNKSIAPQLCTHRQIEIELQQYPTNIALRHDSLTVDYNKLNSKANRLANYLMSRGVEKGCRIGIKFKRSISLIVSMLASMKVGAAYIPFDMDNSPERNKGIVRDASIEFLLSDTDYSEFSQVVDGYFLNDISILSESWLSEFSDRNLDVECSLDDPVYIIYTSGSTGEPKGVEISHRSLISYLTDASRTYYSKSLNGSLLAASHAFDISVPSIYMPLLQGGTIEILEQESVVEQLYYQLTGNRFSSFLIRITPSHLLGLLELINENHYNAEHVFVIGGEPLESQHVMRLQSIFPNSKIYNHYGPTECTVGCTIYNVSENIDNLPSPLPIGKPFCGAQLYILDQFLRKVPSGVVGELHVSGSGLATGYINRKDLSDEKFIVNPFVTGAELSEHARIYKTGDLVRLGTDGNIEYIGRIDDQIKVNGYRVELGEIKKHITMHPEVASAFVTTVSPSSHQKLIVAYVKLIIADEDDPKKVYERKKAAISQLKFKLGEGLPYYMQPKIFHIIERWPMSANGKLNARALPEPDFNSVSRVQFVEARDEVERKLCDIWKSLLSISRISVLDSFFDLGGHSLLMTKLLARIRTSFGVEVSIKDAFECDQLLKMADLIRRLIEIDAETESIIDSFEDDEVVEGEF